MELDEAIGHAKRGNALLFTGAGFSFGAKNSMPDPDSNVPDAREFARRLARQLGSSAEFPLQIVSQSYLKREGEHGLVRELINNFSITRTQDYHQTIAELPWLRVYTTNYDNCLEAAALKSKKIWTPRTTDAQITSDKLLCVHINGYIAKLDTNTLSSQVKLTHTSYSADSFANSKWSEQLRQDANSAKAVIFIGYSMSDLDIARVFFASPDLYERTFFVVSPHDDDIVISPLEAYGSVHRIGVTEFANIIRDTKVTIDSTPHQYTWLRRYTFTQRASPPDDLSAIELIIKGVTDSSSVAWAMVATNPVYCVRRSEVNQILEYVRNGRRWFLCHADLGNGKSILKEQLSFILNQLTYQVFWDSDFDVHKASDLRALARETSMTAVFLDETSERFDAIDGLLQLNLPHLVVIVCARTTLYELGEARYDDHLPEGYIPIDLNRLQLADAKEFVALFNKLGLWGERARKIDQEKLNFLNVECSGAVSKLIVSTFEVSEVGNRIKRAADRFLNDRSDLAAVVIASFLCSRIGHTPRPELLSSLLNKDVWQLMRSETFKQAGEFIRFQQGHVAIRSSIISDYLLKNVIKPEVLIWHIERFVRRLAEVHRTSTLHHMFTEMQRFPILSQIVGNSKETSRQRKKEIIIGFYQSTSDLPFCQRNALFWLHYAMARLEFNEFDVATLYFEQAKKFAEGREGDTRDVNNHFARLLLDSRIRSDEYNDHFKAFEKAHEILLGQMNKDTNRHYPYRQAKKYVDFIAYRKGALSATEVEAFKVACKQVKSAIKNVRGTLSGASEIRDCDEHMDRALKIASLTS